MKSRRKETVGLVQDQIPASGKGGSSQGRERLTRVTRGSPEGHTRVIRGSHEGHTTVTRVSSFRNRGSQQFLRRGRLPSSTRPAHATLKENNEYISRDVLEGKRGGGGGDTQNERKRDGVTQTKRTDICEERAPPGPADDPAAFPALPPPREASLFRFESRERGGGRAVHSGKKRG